MKNNIKTLIFIFMLLLFAPEQNFKVMLHSGKDLKCWESNEK